MPRFARVHAPGSVQHIISRFVNREHRMGSDEERAYYLSGVPRALAHSDWRPVAFALMSSHIHWVFVAGESPLWRFIKPLHIRFATWLNRRQNRLGPVFAHRPTTVIVEGNVARLLAYVHNNPVRAGVVADPACSSWTSHRAYFGYEHAPAWLDIEAGLRMCEIDGPDAGEMFHRLVVAHSTEARDPVLSGGELSSTRRRMRRSVAAPVEVSSARVDLVSGRMEVCLLAPASTPIRRLEPVALEAILMEVAKHRGHVLAALLQAPEKLKGKRVACIVSGGNVDPHRYARLLTDG